MARQPFMTFTLTLSKAKFKDLVHESELYHFEDNYDEDLMEKHKISISNVMNIVENSEEYYNNMKKELTSALKACLEEEILADPLRWNLDTITCKELTEFYDRCAEIQETYDTEQEIIKKQSIPENVRKAIAVLEREGYAVFKN